MRALALQSEFRESPGELQVRTRNLAPVSFTDHRLQHAVMFRIRQAITPFRRYGVAVIKLKCREVP